MKSGEAIRRGGAVLCILALAAFGAAGGVARAGCDPPACDFGSRGVDGGVLESGPFGCPDIASTQTFREQELEYVHSQEFADAMTSVVEGSSRYSFAETPGTWDLAARGWRIHLLAHRLGGGSPFDRVLDWERYRMDEEECSPYLVHLASREYARRRENRGVAVVYPFHVQMAVLDLAESVAEYRARILAIRAILAKARRLEEGDLPGGGLDRAMAFLEEARRLVVSQVDVDAVERAFDRAEEAARELMGRRMLQRFACYGR